MIYFTIDTQSHWEPNTRGMKKRNFPTFEWCKPSEIVITSLGCTLLARNPLESILRGNYMPVRFKFCTTFKKTKLLNFEWIADSHFNKKALIMSWLNDEPFLSILRIKYINKMHDLFYYWYEISLKTQHKRHEKVKLSSVRMM